MQVSSLQSAIWCSSGAPSISAKACNLEHRAWRVGASSLDRRSCYHRNPWRWDSWTDRSAAQSWRLGSRPSCEYHASWGRWPREFIQGSLTTRSESIKAKCLEDITIELWYYIISRNNSKVSCWLLEADKLFSCKAWKIVKGIWKACSSLLSLISV